MAKLVYTIKKSDVGKCTLKATIVTKSRVYSNISTFEFMGYIQKIDIDKRIYLSDGIFQVENQAQLNNRLTTN